MSRSVVLDTETTGLDPAQGDRVIEVAAVELENDLPTGRAFHRLIDPERDIPEEASRVHGITRADLAGKPRFAAIAADLLAFLAEDPIIAHNAPFDFGFLDAELTRLGQPKLARVRMIDTLVLAKAKYPGLPNSLDALCRRFGIDLSERTTHNALLDCQLLAAVHVELTGGRQRGLGLAGAEVASAVTHYQAIGQRTARPIVPDEAAAAAHAAFIARLKDPIWLDG